ncbi:hypothetical protein EU513_13895 [Yimella sp. RIT 621]|uniref:hypothetical protein n=1 Tax=Yimella sp. RIT 621 TaxID=2510323 RepID=UPI00101D2508|nr:hypothetical protein [Yimella sp. RIT 621]RYG76137.1 hypothetical protein EU513_13895 [Yimella sp. RIT 621]
MTNQGIVLSPDATPRVAFIGDQEQCSSLQGIFPTERQYTALDGTLHPPDYDAFVSVGQSERPAITRGVLFGQQALMIGSRDYPVRAHCSTVATGTKLVIAAGLDDEVTELLKRTVVPEASKLLGSGALRGWILNPNVRPPSLKSLLCTSDGVDLVMHGAPRSNKAEELWLLPSFVTDRKAWLLLAWRSWAKSDERLPGPPHGYEHQAWMTPAELSAWNALKQVEVDRERMLGELQKREDDAQRDLDAAQDAAVQGARRLLTEEGDELVSAVMDALQELGFEATDADAALKRGEMRRHDVEVRSPDAEGVIIAEVKGTKKGTATSWFQQIGSHERYYMSQHAGDQPAGKWLVVNPERGKAPDARGVPYTNNNAADLAVFGQDGGLVVPTKSLFSLVRDVQLDELDATAARRLLLETTGRLDYPSPNTDDAG